MNIEIYYPTNIQSFVDTFGSKYPKVSITDIDIHYFKIYEFNKNENVTIDSYLDELFALFNNDENPLSEKYYQEIIINNKLHTSMSMGDVIKINNEYYIVCGIGFKKLT